MKTRTFSTIVFGAVLLLCNIQSNAEVAKKVHKSWPINKVVTLAVDNKYGNISFNHNRSDSVTIDVLLETDKNTRNGMRIVEMIDFEFSLENGRAEARTEFNDGFRSNQNFTINYIISIPEDRNLEVDNKYGNVSLNDLNANGSFEIAYGNISGNSLNAPQGEKIHLDLKYGSATFEKINRLLADVAYSKFRSININEAELDTRYSTLVNEKCDMLFANSRYDSYNLSSVIRVKSDSKFTNWKIENTVLSAEFVTEYGDIKIYNVPANFEKINVQNRYGNIRIGIASNASYYLKGETFYCDLIFPDSNPDKYIKEENHTIVQTMVGSKSSNSKVNIESRYGKVDLME